VSRNTEIETDFISLLLLSFLRCKLHGFALLFKTVGSKSMSRSTFNTMQNFSLRVFNLPNKLKHTGAKESTNLIQRSRKYFFWHSNCSTKLMKQHQEIKLFLRNTILDEC